VFYTWDFDNRLVAVDTNGDGTIDERNVYDAKGNLVSQTVGGQETRFLIDTVQRYPQVLLEYRPSGQITASYVYGNRLISQTRGDVESFYEVDRLGSTRLLTNNMGLVTDRYTYDAFGVPLASVGTTLNTHLFLSEQIDQNTGFINLRARYLIPQLGRFASRDSFAGLQTDPITLNHYIYAGAEPVDRTDPAGQEFDLSGLSAAQAIQAVLAEIGGIVGFIYGYQKGGLVSAFEYQFAGAAIGYGLGLAIGFFIPAAGVATPATAVGTGDAAADAYIAQNGGYAVVSRATQLVSKAGGLIKYSKSLAVIPIPGIVKLFSDELGQPQGYVTLSVLGGVIKGLLDESAGDPYATQYYQQLLDSLKAAGGVPLQPDA
jgi:RHS repeat-associated protein